MTTVVGQVEVGRRLVEEQHGTGYAESRTDDERDHGARHPELAHHDRGVRPVVRAHHGADLVGGWTRSASIELGKAYLIYVHLEPMETSVPSAPRPRRGRFAALVGLLALTLTACGGGGEDTTTQPAQSYDEAGQVLADLDASIEQAAAENPELDGLTVAVVFPTPDAFYVDKPADPRVQFATDLGLVSAPSVEELANGEESFSYTLTSERLNELTSDVLVVYADSQEAADTFLESPQARLLDQVEKGAVATVVGTAQVAAVSPPTALSRTWALDDYVALLAEAARAANKS